MRPTPARETAAAPVPERARTRAAAASRTAESTTREAVRGTGPNTPLRTPRTTR
ncbi:hypothetical protein [Kineococcus xinjiangensis]|uniref:hypothetical protein n=1 Tax=Kineococcus xinjiangensis TaxID=512762 RepID=UPI001304AC03|nr:hypothetical protein [Kineococcus xinjiangensis]